jgi:hypothetical protein
MIRILSLLLLILIVFISVFLSFRSQSTSTGGIGGWKVQGGGNPILFWVLLVLKTAVGIAALITAGKLVRAAIDGAAPFEEGLKWIISKSDVELLIPVSIGGVVLLGFWLTRVWISVASNHSGDDDNELP